MEAEAALPRLLQLKAVITKLMLEAQVAPDDAYSLLVNAVIDLEGKEWTSWETTDFLLLESIDRQCREYAEMMGKPYQGLRREARRSTRR